jgi:hypothetical protein
MTREEIRRLENSGADRPVLFTGKFRGITFYRGVQWRGPTNAIGFGRLHLVENQGGPCYYIPAGGAQ